MLSCLPMMLQIPIWAALWAALNTSIDMRHAPFDGWWIKDLSGQDALIQFSQPIHIPLLSTLMSGPVTAFNLLPILLGVSQLLQARFMPRGNPQQADPSGNPNQLEQQRKMMMFMSLFFVFILYNAPSGLNLYIMSSNLFGIIEQMRIRKHLQEMEEKGAMAPKEKGPRKKSWLERKWEEAQKMADEAKKVESSRDKKKSSTSKRR
jgi:YidC/Oxa1 family membrane protein insertase